MFIFFQISIIRTQKNELEKKIELIITEKEGLSCNFDDQCDRIFMLEKQNRENETQLLNSRIEMDEMKAVNHSLTTRYVLANYFSIFNLIFSTKITSVCCYIIDWSC